MLTVNVYKLGILVDNQQIDLDFYIMRNDEGEFYWETGDETRERMRHRHDPNRKRSGGVLDVWYMGGNRIKRLSPEWELWINGQQCERGYYRRLFIGWAKVELIRDSYRFEFLQPEIEDHEPAELPRPHHRWSPEDTETDD